METRALTYWLAILAFCTPITLFWLSTQWSAIRDAVFLWQPLIAGSFAILAAVVTVWQMRDEQREERERLRSESDRAKRAQAHTVLSNWVDLLSRQHTEIDGYLEKEEFHFTVMQNTAADIARLHMQVLEPDNIVALDYLGIDAWDYCNKSRGFQREIAKIKPNFDEIRSGSGDAGPSHQDWENFKLNTMIRSKAVGDFRDHLIAGMYAAFNDVYSGNRP